MSPSLRLKISIATLLALFSIFSLQLQTVSAFYGSSGSATQPQYTVDENITRLEFVGAVISSKYAKGELAQKDCFSDVTIDDWFSKQICKAVELGIVAGYPDGTFRPNDLVTTRQAITMFQRAYGLQFDDNVKLYSVPLSYTKKMNIVPTVVTNLDAPITRGTLRDIKSRMENPSQILSYDKTVNPKLNVSKSLSDFNSISPEAKKKSDVFSSTQPQYTVDENITRLEFVSAIISSKYGKSDLTQRDCFTDVIASDWSSKYICKAVDLGIISGYPDGTFKPSNLVTVREAMTMFQRLYGLNFDNRSLYNVPLSYAKKMNIVPTAITNLDAPITRGTLRDMKSGMEVKARVQTDAKAKEKFGR